RVQLTVTLIDATTGTLINTSTINAELANLSTVEDDLVIEVARMLHTSVPSTAKAALSLGATAVPVAYDVYVQGLGYLQRYEDQANIDKAIGLFSEALKRDSSYALAYAALGEAYWRKYDLTKDAQFAELGKDNCQKALTLDDRLAQVYVTLALISN